jgi:hypothetical protein
MSKIRVYEYAKKHNISSKDIITKLKEMNIEVSNHMATIEDAEVKKLDETFSKKDNKAPQQNTENKQNGQQQQRTNSRPTQAQRQNQRPAQSTQRPQVQTKTPKAFEEAADKNAAPSKVKVVSPPKTHLLIQLQLQLITQMLIQLQLQLITQVLIQSPLILPLPLLAPRIRERPLPLATRLLQWIPLPLILPAPQPTYMVPLSSLSRTPPQPMCMVPLSSLFRTPPPLPAPRESPRFQSHIQLTPQSMSHLRSQPTMSQVSLTSPPPLSMILKL